MTTFLRALFSVILVSMLLVTTWAGVQCPLFAVPRSVATHPWFIATLFDAYWGFTTFYVWVCYREVSWTAKLAWLVAIMSLGNIAMSAYCLAALARAPKDVNLAGILTAKRTGPGWLGLSLALVGVAVAFLAASQGKPTIQ